MSVAERERRSSRRKKETTKQPFGRAVAAEGDDAQRIEQPEPLLDAQLGIPKRLQHPDDRRRNRLWSQMGEAIGIRELKSRASEIVRRVREDGASFEVAYRGRTVARLVPVRETASSATVDEFLDQLDRTAAEISQRWPTGVSAVDAVRDVRRDL